MKGGAECPVEFLKAVCYPAYVAWAAGSGCFLRCGRPAWRSCSVGSRCRWYLHWQIWKGGHTGIGKEALREYAEKLSVQIGALETSIYEKAGEEFNINSPKQLGVILFEKLQLPNGKKTKTAYSTAAEVLERLAPNHPIVADILEYRQLAKLKSTYADGLVNYIAEDGRIYNIL